MPTLPPPPVAVRHAEYTLLMSADDDCAGPDDFLLDLALKAISAARTIELKELCGRMSTPPYYPEVWPGEHYRLLAGLVQALSAAQVVEIGTSTGLSALALKKCLPADGRIYTFDIYCWQSFKNTALRDDDFLDGRLEQHVVDLSSEAGFLRYRE